MFFDIITILWQTVSGLFAGIFTSLWEMLPEILQLRQIAAYLTPAGLIAALLGVPVVLITIVKFIIKQIHNQ